ncbi:MAG TPA: cupin domain-containing protein [Candidatus Salinicoccus stercoripullorum]|uniref:Cupin domain-containing protein n=1 Tax=Candidatus Salinicoccus stercoripullorum TaxID=2838756 RepID=A0A9D1U1W4_9STAP|nr:cupin domain-containing protein [Candidatus Salinicoccus stercoripullorum]
MKTAQQWIEQLDMSPHPEGGYYREMERSDNTFEHDSKSLPQYTTIYFLLTAENPSRLHQLSSDEIWFFHDGNPLTVHSISPDGEYKKEEIGPDSKLQHTVAAGDIFGSSVEKGYALVSCAVVPGFDFSNFRLFTQEELVEQFPSHEGIIRRLAYESLD